MLRKVPLIVILGSTGTGKTKLSIELAERFAGEIISADSMQVYANLDVVTAKATKEERSRAKHHLLDVATPSDPFTVVHFRNAALPIIDNLLEESKPPIVVGGTNYYIESLLWDILVSPKTEAPKFGKRKHSDEAVRTKDSKDNHLSESDLDNWSSEKLHDHLKAMDPETANRLHPNNKRKIRRAIEFYQENGQTLSAKLSEQRGKPGGNRLGGPLRYPHTILFWLRCQQDILNARLDKRVDSMLEQGLLAELRAFHETHHSTSKKSRGIPTDAVGRQSNPVMELVKRSDTKTTDCKWISENAAECRSDVNRNADTVGGNEEISEMVEHGDNPYTRGVLQTIGYKEFLPYLEQFNAADDQKIEEYLRQNSYKFPTANSTKDQPSSPKAQKHKTAEASTASAGEEVMQEEENLPGGLEVLKACLNELKLVTQRYSKKQIKWINNRFLASKDRQVPDLYELDTSDVSAWQQQVHERAVTVIEAYRKGLKCDIEPMAKRQHPGAGLNEETSNFCQTCKRYFIGEYQWQLHLKSNKHKKRSESERKWKKLQQKDSNMTAK